MLILIERRLNRWSDGSARSGYPPGLVLGTAMILWGIERSLDEHLWLGEDGHLGSLLVQIAGPEPTAIASFNHHLDHFGSSYGIELTDGRTAHSACLGFGHERIVLALLRTHGLDPDAWPTDVRSELWRR